MAKARQDGTSMPDRNGRPATQQGPQSNGAYVIREDRSATRTIPSHAFRNLARRVVREHRTALDWLRTK